MAIYPHKRKRALHQCRRGHGLWSWSYNATCNPARTQERYQGSAALDSRERVVTRLCVLGMPLTGRPAQSACRMVLRLPLLWTSAYTDVRVLLRALPAGFHLTTIGRLGPSPVERVDHVICLNNHHRATWSQPRCAESIPGFSREGQCPVAIYPHKLKHALHRCGRGQGLWSWGYSATCDLARAQSHVQCHVTGPAEVQEGAWPLVSGIQRKVWPCAKAGGVPQYPWWFVRGCDECIA